MFDYTLAHWTTFLTATILLNLSPGPDIAFILAQTVKNGKRSGVFAMFGVWTGAFIHVLLAALGLTAILATSALAFSVVKWIGAIYLVWIGIQALRSNGASFTSTSKIKKSSDRAIFQQGMLVSALNPKVAIFFLAFLPQFVEAGAGSTSAQLFLHGSLVIVVAAFIEPFAIILGAKLTNHLNKNTGIATWLDRGLGSLLIGLGVKLALTER